jgi:hypothetical protein
MVLNNCFFIVVYRCVVNVKINDKELRELDFDNLQNLRMYVHHILDVHKKYVWYCGYQDSTFVGIDLNISTDTIIGINREDNLLEKLL